MADIRLLLNDKAIARLPDPASGWYLARDTELKGFFVVVGKRKKTFTVQGDLRRAGKRASTIRVAIGDAGEVSTRTARATARDYLLQISRDASYSFSIHTPHKSRLSFSIRRMRGMGQAKCGGQDHPHQAVQAPLQSDALRLLTPTLGKIILPNVGPKEAS